MKLKKSFLSFLLLIALVFSLSGCGNKNTPVVKGDSSFEQQSSVEKDKLPKDTESKESESEETEKPSESSQTEASTETHTEGSSEVDMDSTGSGSGVTGSTSGNNTQPSTKPDTGSGTGTGSTPTGGTVTPPQPVAPSAGTAALEAKWKNSFGLTDSDLATIDAVVNSTSGQSRDQRIRSIHDWMIAHITYDYSLTKYHAHNAVAEGTCVCQGYAELFEVFMDKIGVENSFCYGTGNGGSHAWNAVKLDGYWYYMDVTWNSTTGMNRYYLITYAEISKDHGFESPLLSPNATTSAYEDAMLEEDLMKNIPNGFSSNAKRIYSKDEVVSILSAFFAGSETDICLVYRGNGALRTEIRDTILNVAQNSGHGCNMNYMVYDSEDEYPEYFNITK